MTPDRSLPSVQTARALAAALAAVLTAGCASVRPYSSPIVTDRPDFTESPIAVPTGAVQAEFGHTFERTDDVRANTTGEVLLRLGVRRGMELRLGLPSYVRALGTPDDVRGIGDANLGAKFELVPEARAHGLVPTTAVIVGAGLPTGARALRAPGVAPEVKLLAGWSLSDAWALSSNVNVASLDVGPARETELAGSLSVGRALSERAGSYLEWFGNRTPSGGAHFLNAGVTWLLTANQQLDVRAGSGLGGNRRDYFAGVGLSQRW